MLANLRIKNVALIKSLDIVLNDGLNILSGETGAGKSIIIDSLNFVLGERADKTLIRHGEEVAEVEAVFYVAKNDELESILQDNGIDFEDGTIILRRTMSISGRNETRVNGRFVTAQILRSISAYLCDIHGQHEHQSLLKTSSHLDIVDNFGACDIAQLKDSYQKVYDKYIDICNKCDSFGDDSQVARQIDMLDFAIKEIDRAELYEGIDEEITATRLKLQNTERLAEAVRGANYYLSGDNGSSCEDMTYRAYNLLGGVEKYDESLSELIERLESVKIEISDIADSLSTIADGYVYSSDYATLIEEKYDLIKSLKRKYGPEIVDVMKYRDDALAQKDELENSSYEREKLAKLKEQTRLELYECAVLLSKARAKVATRLEKEITTELCELGMKSTTFKVEFDEIPTVEEFEDRFTKKGIDNVEFLISPNVGEPLKSLAKIISGGEMSRFMLALKVIISKIDGIGTLVFDEIDTGISGAIAYEVAKKLYKISKYAQVIAVTHLPQLASIADNNYLIQKEVVDNTTLTFVKELNSQDKLREIARLAGYVEYNESENAYVKDLVEQLNEFKKTI